MGHSVAVDDSASALNHQARTWSARVAWLAGAVASFALIRVSFLGFGGQEGPGSCGTVPWGSVITLWQTNDLCVHQALGWLMACRVAIVVTVVAVVVWRISYARDTVPD